jgi:AP-1-like transcription factor
MKYPNPVQDPVSAELGIEGLHGHHYRRSRKSESEKAVNAHAQLVCNRCSPTQNKTDFWLKERRRAQNRASGRAFRARTQQHMRELEERLTQLQGQYDDLTQSYESLQLEYSTVRQELEALQRGSSTHETSSPAERIYHHDLVDWGETLVETSNPVLFKVSAFDYSQEEEYRVT